MDNKNVKTTDWLVKGISKKRLKKEKIQALKKEIKYLEAELTVCNEALDNSIKLNNRLQAESEDLKTQFRYLDIECERLEAENERLKESNRLLINNPVLDWQDDLENEIKVEAYKEFAEKVEERIAVKILKDKSNEYAEGFVDALDGVNGEIDNLLKELVGGNK